MEKKIIIIGAGIAGLSAGCYALMNGYEAEIYESDALPGGLCTSWKKGEYTIDGCIHWLTGSAPGDSFYKLWQELGAIQGLRVHNHEEFYRFVDSDGKTLILYNDVDLLESHMKQLSPADTENIDLFCGLIRKFSKFKSPVDKAFELFNFFDFVRMIWKMRSYMKDYNFSNSISIEEFAGRFEDPFMREAFPNILGSRDMTLFGLIMTLALLNNKSGGYPLGGSLKFARTIEDRFLGLGGKIFYGKRVGKILVKDSKACGILLDKGEEVIADYVISCADLHNTVYNLLEGKFIEPQHEKLFQKASLYPSSVQVSFGVNLDLTHEPDCIAQLKKLKSTIMIGNSKLEWLFIRNYSFDPGLAPAGKTVVECMLLTDDFDYWQKLYADKIAYNAEKDRIKDLVSEELEKSYPGFRSRIEVFDVCSPMTYARYTGNYRGTFMTWIMTPQLMKNFRMIKKTLPGLDNFWLSGMWVMAPGGIPTGAKTSRDIIQLICRKDKKEFKTNIPNP
jgi:phytoene dehydrogenase-like protein